MCCLLIFLVAATLLQRHHTGLRIYGPLYLARYFAEELRPKLTQYLERPGEGRPFPLIKREWIYKASKGLSTYEGFGTTKDLHKPGTHTIRPAPFGLTEEEVPDDAFHVRVGNFVARYPAMRSGGSFGAFGGVWTRAASDGGAILNQGYEADQGFLDNTGEGGLSPHHCPVTPEGQEYLDKLTERARQRGHNYTFRFDQTATSDGQVAPVRLKLCRYDVQDGRVVSMHPHAPLGVSEMPRKVIVQLGTSLSGFRTVDGDIDYDFLNYVCGLSFVAGVEIKGQQGAKPNDSSVVPQEKLTAELKALRGFSEHEDYRSPVRHSFIPKADLRDQVDALVQVMEAIKDLPNFRERSLLMGYKMTYSGAPFIIKLAAHLNRGHGPHYLVVDGAEGGTGAGDPIMTDRVGVHAYQAIHRTHDWLRQSGARKKVCLVGSGRVADSGDIATMLALGADYCNVLRGYMMATGCIQARGCNTDRCPAGITTHDKWRQRGLDPTLKAVRFANYGKTLRAKLAKLARTSGVNLVDGGSFHLGHLDVVTGIGKMTEGPSVYHETE